MTAQTQSLEMAADLEDIALTMHPHPALSETGLCASEVGLGTGTDLYLPGKRKQGI